MERTVVAALENGTDKIVIAIAEANVSSERILQSILSSTRESNKDMKDVITALKQTLTEAVDLFNRRSEQQIAVLERLASRKKDAVGDYADDLKSQKQYIGVEARELEREVTWAVVKALTDGAALKLDRYSFCEETYGDVDGIVVGKLNQEDVIVFVEVKHNLATRGTCKKARDELKRTMKYWRSLVKCNRATMTDEDDAEQAMDYDNLNVDAHKNRKVVVAIGGHGFPEFARRYFATLNAPCFLVVNNLEAKFEAALM